MLANSQRKKAYYETWASGGQEKIGNKRVTKSAWQMLLLKILSTKDLASPGVACLFTEPHQKHPFHLLASFLQQEHRSGRHRGLITEICAPCMKSGKPKEQPHAPVLPQCCWANIVNLLLISPLLFYNKLLSQIGGHAISAMDKVVPIHTKLCFSKV